MGKNRIVRMFNTGGSFTVPAGVKKVRASVIHHYGSSIAFSATSSYRIDTNGDLRASGGNGDGQLGINSITSMSSPGLVVGGMKWLQVAASDTNAYALRDNGQLYAWGLGHNGALGNGSTASASSPVLVGPSGPYVRYRQVVTGGTYNTFGGFALAIGTDGTVYSWGANNIGQLGGNTTNPRSTPATAMGNNPHMIAAAGETSFCVDGGGDLYSWGGNTDGILGNGTVLPRSTPAIIASGTKFAAVFAGGRAESAAAITRGGDAYVWGANHSGQLGLGDINPRSTPTLLAPPSGKKWKAFSVGTHIMYGMTTDGIMYSWGGNANGQLGNNTTTPRSTPATNNAGLVSQIAAGDESGGFIGLADGKSKGMGSDFEGLLGTGFTIPRSLPTEVFAASNIYCRTAFDLQANQIEIDVTPGASYQYSVGNYMARFGGYPICEVYGAMNSTLVLEYDA